MRIRANGRMDHGGGALDARAAEEGITLPAVLGKVLDKMAQ